MNTNQITLMSLFETGAHRGNRRSKLNPRLKPKVYGFSKGLCLIDLAQTSTAVDNSVKLLNTLGTKKRQILVVGTSKHVSPLVKTTAEKFSLPMPYVNNRWLGGTLTNWATIRKTLKNKEKLEKIISKEEFFSKLPRNEQLGIERELEKLRIIFDGLVNLKTNKPGAIIVLDADENEVAIKEAQKLKIPVIALTNTSTVFLPANATLPSSTTVCINTNSVKAVGLIFDKFVDSYNEGFKNAEVVQPNITPNTTPRASYSNRTPGAGNGNGGYNPNRSRPQGSTGGYNSGNRQDRPAYNGNGGRSFGYSRPNPSQSANTTNTTNPTKTV
jgi:small subunit ribosomal protein S2